MGRRRKLEGIRTRAGGDGLTRYRGTAYVRGQQEFGPWTPDEQEAIAWRDRKIREDQDGSAPGERISFGEARRIFTEGIESGAIRNRSGRRFKPSVIRDYKRHLLLLEGIVGARTLLDNVHLRQANVLLRELRGKGHSDSWVRNVMSSLRSLSRWAVPEGYMSQNPVQGLSMPITDEKARERIASVEESRLLIGSLDFPYRTMIALGCYAGMRAGEILAIEHQFIDLDRPLIEVEQSWDLVECKLIPPKTKAARRGIPVVEPLQAILEDHRDSYNARGPLFPALRPRRGDTIREGARMAYSAAVRHMKRSWEAGGLDPLGLHEARHTFASMMIAAGATPKAIQTYMGHSSIQVTYDRYGHLMPGHEAEVLVLLNNLLGG